MNNVFSWIAIVQLKCAESRFGVSVRKHKMVLYSCVCVPMCLYGCAIEGEIRTWKFPMYLHFFYDLFGKFRIYDGTVAWNFNESVKKVCVCVCKYVRGYVLVFFLSIHFVLRSIRGFFCK